MILTAAGDSQTVANLGRWLAPFPAPPGGVGAVNQNQGEQVVQKTTSLLQGRPDSTKCRKRQFAATKVTTHTRIGREDVPGLLYLGPLGHLAGCEERFDQVTFAADRHA